MQAIIRPFLVAPDDVEANDAKAPRLGPRNGNHDQLPPVIMHKVSKVFPPLGGAPEKVALKCLDLHVPNGQVLGLLGETSFLISQLNRLSVLSASLLYSFPFIHCRQEWRRENDSIKDLGGVTRCIQRHWTDWGL